MADVSGGQVRSKGTEVTYLLQVRSRPRLRWMDDVKIALDCRGRSVEAARNERLEGVEPWCICR